MNTDIRNIAVIAHVDHGKTTLVDALLKQTHVFRDNQKEMAQTQIMDSNELERERGITILAKNCSIRYKNTKINIIDTPGHADFSGEVERTLGMADGALLIVDAADGPMPQTRFVLKKALDLGLKIIVVINKIDKKLARPEVTLNKVESLFLELASHQAQLDFAVLYAIGRRGVVFEALPENPESDGSIIPLLEAILSSVPAPKYNAGSFKISISSLDYDSHLGRIAIGKIYSGSAKKGMKVILTDEPTRIRTIEKITIFEGLKRVETEDASVGEIVAFSGINDIKIGSTVSDPVDPSPLPQVVISEPTLHIEVGANTSPFSGREGTFTTSRQIEERLVKELESNLSLRVEKIGNGKLTVAGRGELHLSILLETLRREGYELEVSKPEVILRETEGVVTEPIEEVSVIVPGEFIGIITEEFGKRLAKLIKMEPINDAATEFIYHAPTRVLIGLRSFLLTQTKGTIVYNSVIVGSEKIGKTLPKMRKGALIASQSGVALSYGLENAQGRGITFIDPGTKVYEGMIVGINAKDEDMAVNVCKGKKLTNMRSKSSDGVIQLTPATTLSLEQSLDFLEKDELLEITPKFLRLRKKHLTELERRRVSRKPNDQFLSA
ncbi:GTP-binding protein TypA [Candidatus Woesebacteria bacterium RIFCSPHIGHO2_01_FULL_39_32]|uniref:GTP-binding protein TypA n=1 Tax=Candidatus Woesebacteria bacterium RIFCSPLOWO2_01_FULL_39_25 TaxID=1802521 RepID=A0A1F8BP05_9BACT|nr:MAG: GTP-binding protein TypA [Candidatus Woesebacteria bacterium GWB1_37_5]OGM25477.1 MAG: GTP-binding protein TypA [Candidatus Woesebacteria bacterium RIFCSPHIGHO2_01_FULL_39_32]OGM38580.1 MAG: GTP-binding protein TypA [Candidatus Woesebacteria bacterium RIFCSPHIGHO2_12_FULL_38_11]OGM65008.1 MAG: GTP-binding protein TypA [Candidatus Woesebacteria bacterium RIFCSPLOWO2_01_FULL_39_25]